MKGVVYCYRNLQNDKKYIGKTINEKYRINKHKRNALISTTPFYNAIRKYGWDDFEYSILYEIEGDDKYMIDSKIKQKEKECILLNNSILEGYNLTEGGDGSCGLYPSDEVRFKMSIKRQGNLHPMFGKKSSMAKPVFKVSDNNEILEEYYSIEEAAFKNNAKKQHIVRCCRGIRNKTRGFRFKFKNEWQ